MTDAKTTRATRLREKSEARRNNQKLEVKRALLGAASELFLEGGLEGFSLRGVAERVGYSATTVYLYFENKDDLLFAVSLEGFEGFGRALQTAYDSTPDPVERIAALGRAYITFGMAHPAHYRLMFMERGEFLTKTNPHDQKPTVDSFGILVRAVHELYAAGRVRDPDADPMTLVYTIWAGVHGLVALSLCVPLLSQADLHARTEHLLEVLYRGFAETG